jgi:Peptidase family M28
MALPPVTASLRADVETLAGMTRDSAGIGERASARWIARRLEEVGATDVRVEPFRYQSTYAWAQGLHAAAGLAAVRVRGVGGAALALGALVSLELEVSGRRQWLRRLLPAGEGANVVARVPPGGERCATLVVVAHHDAARTGFFFRPEVSQAGAHRRLRRRSIDPYVAPVALPAFGLAALGAVAGGRLGRVARGGATVLLGAALAADMDIATERTVPGANDNATGVAALLELAERFAAEPLPGVEVMLVVPGCEESGMGGMAAWLAAHRDALDPATTLVLCLDTLGSGTPIVLEAEGALLRHRYRPEDLELADAGARRAGAEPVERWRIGGWTDAVLAVFAGLPAISLLSLGPKGIFTHYHHPTDVPEHVDFDCVHRCIAVAAGIAAEWAARSRS